MVGTVCRQRYVCVWTLKRLMTMRWPCVMKPTREESTLSAFLRLGQILSKGPFSRTVVFLFHIKSVSLQKKNFKNPCLSGFSCTPDTLKNPDWRTGKQDSAFKMWKKCGKSESCFTEGLFLIAVTPVHHVWKGISWLWISWRLILRNYHHFRCMIINILLTEIMC